MNARGPIYGDPDDFIGGTIPHKARLQMNRISPTPEDNEILQHHIRRVMKDVDAKWPRDNGTRMIGIIRNVCGDYLHFAPETKAPDHVT